MGGELTYFRNSIDNFIFRNPISDEEFVERFPDDADAVGEFPFVEFVARDSVLQGVEAHADVELGGGLIAELGFDLVRGELRDTHEALPRIPPTRFIGGLRYQRNAFQAGGEVVAAAKQDRVFGEETPTDGYNLLKLFASYSFGGGKRRQYDYGAARQRDQRALPQPPVVHQGFRARDGPQLQGGVFGAVLAMLNGSNAEVNARGLEALRHCDLEPFSIRALSIGQRISLDGGTMPLARM